MPPHTWVETISVVCSHRDGCYWINLGITLLSCPYYQPDEARRPAGCIRRTWLFHRQITSPVNVGEAAPPAVWQHPHLLPPANTVLGCIFSHAKIEMHWSTAVFMAEPGPNLQATGGLSSASPPELHLRLQFWSLTNSLRHQLSKHKISRGWAPEQRK